jgi:hypothetical protein
MKHLPEKILISSLVILGGFMPGYGQTIYVPSGTSGIGSSVNANVGIGTANPEVKFEVNGMGRFTGISSPAANGSAVEISQSGNIGIIEAYNRSAGGIPLRIYGYPTAFLGGNVGVGTTSPGTKLDIGGPTGAVYGTVAIKQVAAGQKGIWLQAYENNNAVNLYHAGSYAVLSTDYTSSGAHVPLVLQTTGANVGIGTINPQGRLDLGNGTGGTSIVWGGLNGANHYASIGTAYSTAALGLVYGLKLDPANDRFLYSYATLNRAGIRVGGNSSDISFFSAPASTQTVGEVFDYGSNTKLIIKESGNVGIGTTSPTHKFSVNGTIRAKEVIVDTGWSDYVFEKGYRLAPLAEIERHIEANGHLPGIPSTAEVTAHGISVGEMQSLLLAKVEEITLHQIAQEKELIRLREENQALRRQLQEIPQR